MKISESPEIGRARALRNWRYGASGPSEAGRASESHIGSAEAVGEQVRLGGVMRSVPPALMDW